MRVKESGRLGSGKFGEVGGGEGEESCEERRVKVEEGLWGLSPKGQREERLGARKERTWSSSK